mgnify:CR=1 FL=1
MNYDVIIIGAGPGGIFAAYELMKKKPECKIAVFEEGYPLEKRKCPIDGDKIKSCINCKRCSIMCGFGGAGAFSDGKYNITNDFGGTLFEYIGKKQAVELMKYVDEINMENGGEGTKLYSTAGTKFKKLCLQNKLNLLDASVRHLGTDINYVVLQNLYNQMKDHMDFYFDTPVDTIEKIENGYKVVCEKGSYECEKCIVSVGRSGSKWMEKVCKDLEIPTKSNRVDIGVRVELPAVIFSHLTDELYESKIVYRTEKFEDNVRTFCMNPNGIVVNENTNGIITVNGHSYEGNEKKTDNTNFALLVAKHFSEPFKDSNGYGESIARLSNMLGGGVIVQRFGDLVRGRRSTVKRIEEGADQHLQLLTVLGGGEHLRRHFLIQKNTAGDLIGGELGNGFEYGGRTVLVGVVRRAASLSQRLKRISAVGGGLRTHALTHVCADGGGARIADAADGASQVAGVRILFDLVDIRRVCVHDKLIHCIIVVSVFWIVSFYFEVNSYTSFVSYSFNFSVFYSR